MIVASVAGMININPALLFNFSILQHIPVLNCTDAGVCLSALMSTF